MRSYFQGLDVTLTFLVIMLVLIALSFWRAHKNPASQLDFFDLLVENGTLDRKAAVFMGSFAMTTWMMIRLTVDGRMTEGYFATYTAAWIVPVVAKMFSPASPTGTTTVSTTSIKTVEAPIDEVK